MKKINILLWVPLRPGSHWTAEGIAQTIEHILSEISEVNITVLVNKEHYSVLKQIFEEQDNINIVPLSFRWLLFKKELKSPKKPKYDSRYFDIETLSVNKNLLNTIFKKISKKISNIIDSLGIFSYGTRLKIFTNLHKYGYFRKYHKTWVPVPIIPWIDQLRGETILSFWDPFGFEYRDFSDVAIFLHKNFLIILNSVTHIVTQSNNNKEYLVKMFQLDPNKISVIYLGYPNYAPLLDRHTLAIKDKDLLIQKWEEKIVKSNNINDYFIKIHKEFINHSLLFRLKKRLTPKTQILMISTQFRPYKGFETLFKTLDKLIKEYSSDMYFIFTGIVPKKLKDQYSHFHENIIEINRVSNKQHALLYKIADLTLHPSYAEGGLGCFPQFESASVGTPCLVNRGRHTDEMVLELNENLKHIVYDFTDVNSLYSAICQILNSQEHQKENIQNIMNSYRSWKEASKEYETLFLQENI